MQTKKRNREPGTKESRFLDLLRPMTVGERLGFLVKYLRALHENKKPKNTIRAGD